MFKLIKWAFKDAVRRYRADVENMGFIWEFHVGIIGLLAAVLAIVVVIEIAIGNWDDIKTSIFAGILIVGCFWLFMMGVGVVNKTARESMLDVDRFYRYKKIALGLFAIMTVAEFLLIWFMGNRTVVVASVFISAAIFALLIAFIVYPYDMDIKRVMRQ